MWIRKGNEIHNLGIVIGVEIVDKPDGTYDVMALSESEDYLGNEIVSGVTKKEAEDLLEKIVQGCIEGKECFRID